MITLRSVAELEEYDRATEAKRQRAAMASYTAPRKRHPVDHSGSLVLTNELRERIAAGKSREAVMTEAMQENAASGPHGRPVPFSFV